MAKNKSHFLKILRESISDLQDELHNEIINSRRDPDDKSDDDGVYVFDELRENHYSDENYTDNTYGYHGSNVLRLRNTVTDTMRKSTVRWI